MPLLAYSVRRAIGALLVFLVVISLTQLAVSQMTGPETYIGRGGVVTPYPLFLHPLLHLNLRQRASGGPAPAGLERRNQATGRQAKGVASRPGSDRLREGRRQASYTLEGGKGRPNRSARSPEN